MRLLKNAAPGALMSIGAFPVLWKNEGCAVRISKGHAEDAGAVISVDAGNVDQVLNGKLAHITGEAAPAHRGEEINAKRGC